MSASRWWLMACLSCLPLTLQAEEIRLVTCPIYRDTDAGKKSGCWLADDRLTAQRYDVSKSPTKPDWNFQILVEGQVSAHQDQACGGVVLEPVRVSVLESPCTRHRLPAEGFPGRAFVLPSRNTQPLYQPMAPPPPPYHDSQFHLFFDFNSTFFIYQFNDYFLDKAITWIRAAKPRHIVVTGYADTQPQVVSGVTLVEPADLAQERARKVTAALLRLGVAPGIITTRWSPRPQVIDAEGADGLAMPSRRRVDIEAQL